MSLDPARKQQPWIVLLPSLTSTDGMRTLVDPNVIDPTGRTAFDWFVPSPDGGKLAVSLSEGGSESGTLHVYDVATGKETGAMGRSGRSRRRALRKGACSESLWTTPRSPRPGRCWTSARA